MSPTETATDRDRPQYTRWLRGALILIALLVVARFILEVAGMTHSITRFISSNAGLMLAAIYLGAIAPLRRVKKLVQLIVPAIIVAVWMAVWVILATLISGAASLQSSHFAEKADWGNWAHLGRHILGHVIEIPLVALLVFILMLIPFLLRRWPIIVGPAALLGGLVVVRFWMEAMDLPDLRTAAWSSTVAVILAAFFVGGMGPYLRITRAGQLVLPSLLLGWTWRFWVFLAMVVSALQTEFKTHFFDPSGGHVVARLGKAFLFGTLIEGVVWAVIIWIIAFWIQRATRSAD